MRPACPFCPSDISPAKGRQCLVNQGFVSPRRHILRIQLMPQSGAYRRHGRTHSAHPKPGLGLCCSGRVRSRRFLVGRSWGWSIRYLGVGWRSTGGCGSALGCRVEVGESPQYGHRIALDRGVRGDDEHIVGDGLGDDDAVEWVPVNVGELEDAEGVTFVDRQGVDPVPLPVKRPLQNAGSLR